MKMLITDLDNTLYDWVAFFSHAFSCLVDGLAEQLQVDREVLLDEFKEIHQKYGNTEQPFAMLELPSVIKKYGCLPRLQLLNILQEPSKRFSEARNKYLKLYPEVEETLAILREKGIVIVGYTESISENAYYRLKKLGIISNFTRIYTLEGQYLGHPDSDKANYLAPPNNLIRIVSKAERKPNPELLLDICRQENIKTSNAIYVGDSLIKDISMAKNAGVKAVWAKYGVDCDPTLWQILVRVTHWTAEDVQREAELKKSFVKIVPDLTVNSFSEILGIIT